MQMSLFQKLRNKTHISQTIFKSIAFRFFTDQAPNTYAKAFPDHPTVGYYDDLVNQAGRSGDYEAVRRLLNKRIYDGCFNTNETFKFLTNTDSYAPLLDDLRRTLSGVDSGLPRRSACNALVARLCKLGRVDDALSVVDDMVRGRYGLRVTTFYPILSALTRKKKMDDAWRVLDLMRSHGLPPDLTAYNYLLTAHCVVGDVESASKLVRKMEEEGLSPDSRTYDALVLGACKAGRVEGAMSVLRRMEDDGVPILYSTHAHVISWLTRRGYHVQAVKFVMAYSGRDEKLDTESFGVLASKLVKLNRPEARLVLSEMDKRGLKMGNQLRDFYEINVRNVNQNFSLD